MGRLVIFWESNLDFVISDTLEKVSSRYDVHIVRGLGVQKYLKLMDKIFK